MPINEQLSDRLTGLRRTSAPQTGLRATPRPAATGLRRRGLPEPDTFAPGQFQRGVAQGTFGLEETAAGAVAAGATVLGAEGVRQRAEQVAQERAQAASEVPQPRISRVADVRTPADLRDWALQGLGQLAPYAVTTPTGAGVGAGLGAGVARAAGATALRQGVRRGALTGAGVATSVPEVGGQYTEQRGAGVEPGAAAAASIPGGITAGALDVIPQVRALRAVTQPGQRSLRRIAGEALVTEPLTEAGQEAIAVGSRATVDPNFDVFTAENAARLGEAAALGAVGGGVLGGGAATGAAINRRVQSFADDRAAVSARIDALRERLRTAPRDEVNASRNVDYDAVRAQLDDIQARVQSGELAPEEASRAAQAITAQLPDIEGTGLDLQGDEASSGLDEGLDESDAEAFAAQARTGQGEGDTEFFSTQVEPEGETEYLYGRSGQAYQAGAANRYLNEGREFGATSLERRVQELQDSNDGHVYRPVSMREVLEAEARQQFDSRAEREAFIARQAQRKYRQVRAQNPRWDDLYNPDDPASFLENFHVIERRRAPPSVRPGGDLTLTAEDIAPPMSPADQRRRAALAASVRAGDLGAGRELELIEMRNENRKLLRPPPRKSQIRSRREIAATTVDGKRQNINAVGLTIAMLRRVQSDAKLAKNTAPTPKRVAEAFFAGLTSLAEHGIDVGALRIPDNTIVFTSRAGGVVRNYTYGEIRQSGRTQLEQRVRDIEADIARMEEDLRASRNVDRAKRELPALREQLEHARSTLATTTMTKTEKATRTIIRGPKKAEKVREAGDFGLAQYIEERVAAAKKFLAAARRKGMRMPAERERDQYLANIRRMPEQERPSPEERKRVLERFDREIAEQLKDRVGVQTGTDGTGEVQVFAEREELAELEAMRRQDFDYDAYSLPTLQQIAAVRRALLDAPSLPLSTLRAQYAQITGREPGAQRSAEEMIKSLQARLGALLQRKDGVNLSASVEPSKPPTIVELKALDTPERMARLQKKLDAWLEKVKLPHKVKLVGLRRAMGIWPGWFAVSNGFHKVVGGELVIYINPALSEELETSVLAHELGHAIQTDLFDTLPEADQRAVLAEFVKWKEKFGGPDTVVEELLKSRSAPDLIGLVMGNNPKSLTVGSLDPRFQEYFLSFNEWFADQTGRWLLGEGVARPPKGPVETFFAKVAELLRRLVGAVEETDPEWGGSVFTLLERMTGVGSGWNSSRSPLDILRGKALELTGYRQQHIRKIFPQGRDFDPADAAWLSVLNGNQTHTEAFRLALNELGPAIFGVKRWARLQTATDGDVGAAYQRWAFGERQDDALGGEFRRLHDQLEQVFETLVDQPVIDTLWQGQAELREHLSLAPGSARLHEAGAERAKDFYAKAWNKVRAGTSAIFVAADARLRASKVPALIELARYFQVRPGETADPTYVEAKNRRIGELVNRARRIYEGKDAAFGEAVLKVLHNPDAELSKAAEDVQQAVRRTWRLMREMRDYLVEAGVEVGDRGERYFPWVFDTEYLGAHADEFIALLSQDKFAAALDELSSRLGRPMTPDKLFQHLMGDGSGVADALPGSDPHAPNFRSLNQRILGFIDELGSAGDRTTLAKFFRKDLGMTLGLYIDRAVKQAEYVRRFGRDNENLNAMLNRAREQGATPEQLELANNLVLAHTGLLGGETAMRLAKLLGIKPPKYGRPIDPRLQRAQGWVMVYQNLRVLSLATITSLADGLGVVVRTGDFGIAFEGFRRGLAASLGKLDNTELTDLAQALGIVDYTLTNEALGWEYGGVYLSGKARKINDLFFRVIGLQAWTRTTRVMALASGQRFLVKHATKPNEHSQRFLRELSLSPEDIQVDGDGNLKVLTRAEREVATPDERARDDRVRAALIRFVDGAILRPNASQRPVWASDPHYALVFHLKGFMYAFHETILRRAAYEAQNGNLTPLLGLGAFIPAMIAGDVLRDLIRHGGIAPHKEQWTVLDYMQEGLHRSGVAGAYGTMGMDVMKDASYGGVSTLGPTIDQLVNPDLEKAIPGQNIFRYWLN